MLKASGVLLVVLLAQSRTVLDGVYSEPQALRGQTIYKSACAECHGASLEGVSAPELTGKRFMDRWREGMLDGIQSFITQRMPLGRSKTLSDKEYLDLLTFILKSNGFPASGTELVPADLSSIKFVGKNGPQPAPDGALVIAVGCLSRAEDGRWLLIRATEPARSRSELSTPEDVKASAAQSLGSLALRLAEMDAVPDFKPEDHNGHKIQTKGYIVRQTNADRISVSSMVMLNSTCLP